MRIDDSADYAALNGVARRVAEDAAELVRLRRHAISGGQTVHVDTKSSDTDLVTAIDHEAESHIIDQLGRLRPDDVFLGEEGGRQAACIDSSSACASEIDLHEGRITWVIDPIDGTVNFLYGYPSFAVSVAAQIGGVTVAGAVAEPMSGRCWSATKEHGSWLDGIPLQVSTQSRLDLALLATGFAYDARRRRRQAGMVWSVIESVRDIRRSGSAALDLCALASGWIDAYCEHGLSRWDWAAGALIAEEAGARVTLPGSDAELGAEATFAATPSITDELRTLLIHCGAGHV